MAKLIKSDTHLFSNFLKNLNLSKNKTCILSKRIIDKKKSLSPELNNYFVDIQCEALVRIFLQTNLVTFILSR